MLTAHRLLPTATVALLAHLAASSAGATIPVPYGSTELGRIVTNCFYVCFGPNCTASGTIQDLEIDSPFHVRGLRLASVQSGQPCSPVKSLTTANLVLPQTVPPGRALVFDVDLLPTTAGGVSRILSINGEEQFTLSGTVTPVFDCFPSSSALCLSDDRFKVREFWRSFAGDRGPGSTVPGSSDDSGLFYFFNADNWEALVKVLNGCGTNDRHWVFSAATTNVEYTLTVTDTQTQTVKTYFNPLGAPAQAVTDTSAFATCP